jgi:hypothetical protein
LQLVPMIWRIKSETRTPLIRIMLNWFKFFKPLIRGAESSYRKCRGISVYHAYHSKMGYGIKYIYTNILDSNSPRGSILHPSARDPHVH